MPYAYWPPGEAFIDNVEITRVGPEGAPGDSAGENLLPGGDFEKRGLTPFSADGPATRIVRGAQGGCVRIDPGGKLLSPCFPVEAGRRYELKLRALPVGAILAIRIEGVVKLTGKWYVLTTTTHSVPAESGDFTEVEVSFDPTNNAPQVAHARVTFTLTGTGSACVDDVIVLPVGEAADER
jgi:hypothetical protein